MTDPTKRAIFRNTSIGLCYLNLLACAILLAVFEPSARDRLFAAYMLSINAFCFWCDWGRYDDGETP